MERFGRNREDCKSGRFNEAQARVDFINPLFAELGWDVKNRQGRPEAYREVVYEVVVGEGNRELVVDVDSDGVPVGIDIHSFTSEIVDITKLEAEGPVFGLVRAGNRGRRVG